MVFIKKISTVFECIKVCGGLDYNFFKGKTANSNQYARQEMTADNKFAGLIWKVQEMVRFHGIMLKMSIDDRQLGGYRAYFEEDLNIMFALDYGVVDFPVWAKKVIPLEHFKKIRAAYHPEVGTSEIREKCHQLHYGINLLNQALKATFVPGPNISFDEGGVASRSRMNPVRQYNKDKPDKFRVDFFVLCNNTPGAYFIIHIDVYQGRNTENIRIPPEIHKMPTTQKAVVNVVIQSKISHDPDGMRKLFMDNWYAAALLLVMLREQYQILGAGTSRQNRIGWMKEQMTLTKKDKRGASMNLYDKMNGVLVTQWNDNKVVSCTSTIRVLGLVSVNRRTGQDILELKIKKALKEYQEYMDVLDHINQFRERGGCFAAKYHFKKWYKKADITVLNFSLLNSFFA